MGWVCRVWDSSPAGIGKDLGVTFFFFFFPENQTHCLQ